MDSMIQRTPTDPMNVISCGDGEEINVEDI